MEILGKFVLVLLICSGLCLLVAFPTMWIVNYLLSPVALVAIYGAVKIGFWKAFWTNFLWTSLFKSSPSIGK